LRRSPILLINPVGAGIVSFGYGRQGYGTGTDPIYVFPDHLPGAQSRLAARNIIDTISDDFYTADFDAPPPPLGAARLEGGWAPGDSGGPLFLPFRIDSGPLTNYLIGDLSAVTFDTGTRDDIYGIGALWTRFSNL
jgi:hypothetical protein